MFRGVILAAGYGTRFFPITKQIPKELLPLINRPALDFIVDEFIAAGITDICVVISPHKRLIKRYYRPLRWLETALRTSGRLELLSRISPPNINMHFTYQYRMRGSGHALLTARRFVGNKPCIVAYPDDLHLGSPPLARQLIDAWEQQRRSILATIYDPPNPQRYGMVRCDIKTNTVQDIIEKPPAHAIPSKYASIGRFLLTPAFFDHLAAGWRRARQNHREYYHIYALRKLIDTEGVGFIPTHGTHLDIGEPRGYMEAIMTYQTLNPTRSASEQLPVS